MKDCYCRDKHGELKKIYKNKTEAKKQADHLWNALRKSVKIYKCPAGSNWHLSSQTQF